MSIITQVHGITLHTQIWPLHLMKQLNLYFRPILKNVFMKWILIEARGGAIQNVPNPNHIFLDIPNKSVVCVWTCSNLYTLLIARRLLIQSVPTLCSWNPLIGVGVHGATNNTPGGTPYCQGSRSEQRASVYLREKEQTPYWTHMAIMHMCTCPHTHTLPPI